MRKFRKHAVELTLMIRADFFSLLAHYFSTIEISSLKTAVLSLCQSQIGIMLAYAKIR